MHPIYRTDFSVIEDRLSTFVRPHTYEPVCQSGFQHVGLSEQGEIKCRSGRRVGIPDGLHSHQSSKAMQTGMVLYFPEPFSIHFVLGGNVYLAVLVGGLPYIFCSFIILIHSKGE